MNCHSKIALMITVEGGDVTQLLNILEGAAKSGRSPRQEEIDALLSTKWISFMTEVYSMFSDFSKEGLAHVLANLTRPEPVAQGMVLARLEEGFRSCLSVGRINSLRRKLHMLMALDYAKAERMALLYLPPGTPIASTIYLSIDTVNPGMTFGGNVSLSILAFNPEHFDYPYLAHELHHLGFRYWIEQNPKLRGWAWGENRDHREIAVNMILHLLSEGLANYFCTPSFVRPHDSADKEHNRKIEKYEESLNRMLLEIQSLLSACVSQSLSIEKCSERLMNLVFDQEGILPAVHFIGAHIIEMLDKDPTIAREDVIDLCKKPWEFFALYSRTHEGKGLPGFSRDVIDQVSSLLGKP
jgi:hypothetical protein